MKCCWVSNPCGPQCQRAALGSNTSIWRASGAPSPDENEWGTGSCLVCTREVRRTRTHQRGETLNLNVLGNTFAEVDVDAHQYMLVDQYFGIARMSAAAVMLRDIRGNHVGKGLEAYASRPVDALSVFFPYYFTLSTCFVPCRGSCPANGTMAYARMRTVCAGDVTYSVRQWRPPVAVQAAIGKNSMNPKDRGA